MIETLEQETILCDGKPVPHNGKLWRTSTNRHPTTYGFLWGDIEGPDVRVCWENGSAFNHEKATAVCREHNQWLEDQKSITLRIQEQTARTLQLKMQYDDGRKMLDDKWVQYQKALETLRHLRTLDK